MNDLETQLETLNKMHADFEDLRVSLQKHIRDNGYPWRLRVIELRGVPHSPVTSLRLDVPDRREFGYATAHGYNIDLYPEVLQALDYGIRNKVDPNQLARTLIDIWKRIKQSKSHPSGVKVHHVEVERPDDSHLSRSQRYRTILKIRGTNVKNMAKALRNLSGF